MRSKIVFILLYFSLEYRERIISVMENFLEMGYKRHKKSLPGNRKQTVNVSAINLSQK